MNINFRVLLNTVFHEDISVCINGVMWKSTSEFKTLNEIRTELSE